MKFHIVSNRENIEKIAFLYNMDVEEIKKENRHIRDFYNLLPGTKLKIPVLSENVMSEINEFEPFIEDYYPKYDLNEHIEEYVSENQKEDNNEYVNEKDEEKHEIKEVKEEEIKDLNILQRDYCMYNYPLYSFYRRKGY